MASVFLARVGKQQAALQLILPFPLQRTQFHQSLRRQVRALLALRNGGYAVGYRIVAAWAFFRWK